MGAELVVVERRDHVLVVRIDRGPKRNAVNPDVTAGLDAALNRLEDDPELRVGILTGTDSVFSAGSDLVEGSGKRTERGGPYGVCRRARTKPLIAAVEGFALGGGFEMVLACDLVVASRGASFGLPEAARGLLALYGGLFRSARALPLNVAKEIALTGKPLDAERAWSLGLVNRLTEPGSALDAALGLAGEIAGNAPVSVRESLRVIERAAAATDEHDWDVTTDAATIVRSSQDSAEGIAAFRERRAPRWSGR